MCDLENGGGRDGAEGGGGYQGSKSPIDRG